MREWPTKKPKLETILNHVKLIGWALLAVLGAGCRPCTDGSCDFGPNPPAQPVAEYVVWRGLFSETVDPPEVIWVAEGNCPTAAGPRKGILNPVEDICVWGISYADVAYVLTMPLETDTWNTYAHELLHVHLGHLYDDRDHDHTRAEWNALLPEARRRLIEAGVF